jgi:hypothetical protein
MWSAGESGGFGFGSGPGQYYLVRLSGHESRRLGLSIGSSNVGLFWVSDQISDHLVFGHFEFWIISDHVGSIIGSSNVRSFKISDRISPGRVRRVCRVESGLFSN